ncbi:MAG: beta-ketoacyl-ACP synthase II [Ktedonobacterales bacterium]
MTRRVVVTGIGLITPVGNDTNSTWQGLCEGRSGVSQIESFDTSDQVVHFAAEVRGFDPSQYMDRKAIRRNDRFVQFALAATHEAMTASGFTVTDENADQVGVLIGSGVGGLHAYHDQFHALYERGPHRVSPFFMTLVPTDMASGIISITTGARGPNFTVVSACATGANAIGEAAAIIKRGDADAMIAGGSESGITPMTMAAFASMHAISQRNDDPVRASRPFDAERDGFVVGEGAGILILEEEQHACGRGAPILAELAGYAATSDAYHIVEPAPGGAGLARAIKRALRNGGIAGEQVDYINAHGTSTVYNDLRETEAVKSVFGDHARSLAISSTKSMIGHTFGAAGAIEAAISILTIRNGIIPPTINLTHPDPECDLDYVPNTAREARVNVALSNSMGFGGHNAVLAFRRYEG